MVETSALPSADELFQKWKQFLEVGALTSARAVAADHPDLVDSLQVLINSYLADRAAGVEQSYTALDQDPRVPELPPDLPGYRVLGPLGEGGMGVVYRVRDALDREYALKVARKGQLTRAGRDRFFEEAKAMASLDGHPNVAPVGHYDATPAGRPYFLMPVYPANLTGRLAEYQADSEKAVCLMAAVADGVAHLHARGFIHRDLKPHNILLDAHGRPAVSDFGLVKCVTDATAGPPDPPSNGSVETKKSNARRSSKTAAGSAVGTRAYMSPEQAAGLSHLASPRWDVWALGVILHELLTGHRPLSSAAPERLLDLKEPDNPPPTVVRPGLDSRLDRVIRKCLARDESDRYADAGEVAGALHRVIRSPTGRRRAVVGIALAVVLIGLSVLAVWYFLPASLPDFTESAGDPLADARDRLQAGETVVLIPESGMPKWSRPLRGNLSKAYLDHDHRAYTLDTNGPHYVELFNDPGIDHYRFEVEVKQLRTADWMGQGAFAGLQDFPSTYDRSFALTTLGFKEFVAPDDTNRLSGKSRCRHLLLCAAPDGNEGASGLGFGHHSFVGVASPADRPWRRVAVDVSPTEFVWWLDQTKVGTSAAVPDRAVRSNLLATAYPLGTDFSYSPRGGLGLVVEDGIASFRNAKLIPLPAP